MKKFYLGFITILLTALTMLTAAPSVYADCGPKPSVQIKVENPPEGDYYIDFFVEGYIDQYSGDDDLLAFLYSYNEDGYRARLRGSDGLGKGPEKSNSSHTYDFFYITPDEFKIIIVTEDLHTIVSPLIKPRALNTRITFDASACTAKEDNGAVTEHIITFLPVTIFLFILTCSVTLLSERLVFLCFRIKMKNNGNFRIFFLMNIATQLFLYVVLELSAYTSVSYDIVLMAAEIIILAAEACLFAFKMKDSSKLRITLCTISANLFSAVGVPLIFAVSCSLI